MFLVKSNTIKPSIVDTKNLNLIIDDYFYIEGMGVFGITRRFRFFELLCESDYILDTDNLNDLTKIAVSENADNKSMIKTQAVVN